MQKDCPTQSSGQYNRPRRPNADTVTYLRGLPLNTDVATAEATEFLQNNGDFPQSVAAALSASDEVRTEIASLAGDELGSQCLEILAQVLLPYSETAARVFLSACAGYYLHLSTHRYGSHVLQTMLRLASTSLSTTDLALYDDAPHFSSAALESLPSLEQLISDMVGELRPSVTDLSVHVCGSHVLRSLLSVLGGVDLVSSGPNKNVGTAGGLLRGRTKGKKRKKDAESNTETNPHSGTMNVVRMSNARVKSDNQSLKRNLETLTFELLGNASETPGVLQQQLCHPSAGPLYIILLKVLTISTSPAVEPLMEGDKHVSGSKAFRLGIVSPEPTFVVGSLAHQVANRILCWDEGTTEKQKHVGDVIFGLSGEPRGSHMLETLFKLAPDDIHASLIHYGDFENPTSLQEYAEHEVSNFVVQTLFTTIRTKESAEAMLKAMEKLISSGFVLDKSKKRRGLLWRAAELSSKFRVGQETLLKSVRLGFGALRTEKSDDMEQGGDNENAAGKKKKQRKKATALSIKDCIPLLIDLSVSGDTSERATLDVPGTRAVYHMLRFAPRLCEEPLAGILDEFSSIQLELLAKDGLGSICILDGILEGPVQNPVFANASKKLLTLLAGRWVSLAGDRVGHHTVKKLFHALPKIDDKSILLQELSAGANRLQGSPMGRSVAEACFVTLYDESRKEWKKAVTSGKSGEAYELHDESHSKRKVKHRMKFEEKPHESDDAKQ
eukprot:Nitzschia sp. Nitz4//scaffold360_size15251//2423//4600//NITZ4_008890-RA/size15251-processed-gene-0.3-mRNA-1//-1//CDS//3329549227//8878//frame0